MLINAHGVHGTLYCIGECLIILHNEEVVIKATDYFGVFHCNQYCSFVKGMLFEFDRHVHDYSVSPFLVPSTVEKVYSSDSILCKGILFPDPENLDSVTSFVLIDYIFIQR